MKYCMMILLFLVVGCVSPARDEQSDVKNIEETEQEAVAALEELGAGINKDKEGKVIGVFLSAKPLTDASLVHLKGLTTLEELNLCETQITDAGLVHLKELKNLTFLSVAYTQITDVGLVHLKGLTKLEKLELLGVKPSDAGVAELQKALPNCEITR